MSAANTRIATAELQAAFDALARYDRGSGRGALVPIDHAVAAATVDAALRGDLEQRLVAVLRGPAAVVAKEYACGKLAQMGGPASVTALAGLLREPELAHAATNALQSMPAAEAGRALQDSLDRLAGPTLAGVITALGIRRDAGAVTKLVALLRGPDTAVASAAAAALGEIGTSSAAKALREFLPKAPPAVQSASADACLACAERLKSSGDNKSARALLDALLVVNPPSHIRAAALRLAS